MALIDFAALENKYKLPSGLLNAVMRQESGGNPNAVSPKGALGTFQFMPATAAQYGIDPLDPNQAAEGAAKMYSELLTKYNGDLPSALAGYNWGQGNVDRKGLASAPAETRQYIDKIQANLPQYTQNNQQMNDAGGEWIDIPLNDFGNRADGTPKGNGYLGVLKRPDGDVSTEISVGVNIGGKEMDIPTLVPTLNQEEINELLSGKAPTPAIIDKAVAHAKQRISKGKNVFADNSESKPNEEWIDLPPNEAEDPAQQQVAPQQDYATRLTGDLQSAGGEMANIINSIGNQNPASSALQILGQGAKVAGAPVAQGLSSLASYIPQGVKDYIGNSAPGQYLKETGQEFADKSARLSQSNPEIAADLGAGANVLSTLYGGKAATAASAPIGKKVAASEFIKDVSSKSEPIAAAVRATGEAAVPTLDKTTAQLAKRATEDFEIPLRLDQISPTRVRKTVQKVSQELPFSGVDAAETVQRAQWNKQVAKTLGQDADNLAPEVINKFLDDANVKFETAIGDKPLKFEASDAKKFDAIAKDAHGNITKDYSDIVSGKVKGIKDQLFKTVEKTTTIPDKSGYGFNPVTTTKTTVVPRQLTGQKLSSIRSKLIKELPDIAGDARGYVSGLIDAIDDIAAKNMTKESAATLKQARKEWRNYRIVEPLLEKAVDGQINPTELLNRVKSSKYIKASRLETGKDDLVDLARIGKQFLPKAGGSDTAQKAALMIAAKRAGTTAGGLLGLGAAPFAPGAAMAGAALTGGAIAGNKGLQALNQSQKLVSKSINKSLKK